jgi:DNA-binding MarR family transcriptional regulator
MRRRAVLSKPLTLSGPELRRLAWFRYQLRRYLRFSERAARAAGLTPQQYQLLLGVAGHTGRGWATVSELAEFLQERHNAVVGLVERAARRRLVRKKQGARDRRFVRVLLSRHGRKALRGLAQQHLEELGRLRSQFLRALQVRSRAVYGAGRA